MMHNQSRLQEVAKLWTNPNPENLQRILGLCTEIEEVNATGAGSPVDRGLLLRTARLAVSAQRRSAECLAIQAQTGNYSLQGEPERMPRLSTEGWEG